MSGPITRAKLTKTFFMALAEGGFIVSNTYNDPQTPVYAGKVASLEKREEQWREIKKSHADGGLCEVFQDVQDYMEDRRSIRNLPHSLLAPRRNNGRS